MRLQSSLQNENTWIRLSDVPVQKSLGLRNDDAVVLNDTEFIFSSLGSRRRRQRKISMMKYCSITNQWIKWGSNRSRNMIAANNHSFSLDKERKLLFLFKQKNIDPPFDWTLLKQKVPELRSSNKGRSTNNQNGKGSKWTKLKNDCRYVGNFRFQFGYVIASEVVFLNGIGHSFVVDTTTWNQNTSTLNLHHCILNEEIGDHMEVSKHEMAVPSDCEFLFSSRFSCLYVSRLNRMLLILQISDNIASFTGYIWNYDLESNTCWRATEIVIPFRIVALTLSFDGRYVLMTGREESAMFVMDISRDGQFEMLQTDISIPKTNGDAFAEICGWDRRDTMFLLGDSLRNEMLVVGWIKRLFRKYIFRDLSLPPLYLLQMIGQWVSSQDLHYIHCCKDESAVHHDIISLNRILASTRKMCQVCQPTNDMST